MLELWLECAMSHLIDNHLWWEWSQRLQGQIGYIYELDVSYTEEAVYKPCFLVKGWVILGWMATKIASHPPFGCNLWQNWTLVTFPEVHGNIRSEVHLWSTGMSNLWICDWRQVLKFCPWLHNWFTVLAYKGRKVACSYSTGQIRR